MVGDDWDADILGALGVGMSCVYLGAEAPRREDVKWVRHLADLEGALHT